MSSITIAPERLREHLRVPMFRDGYALVLGWMITAVVGAAYWVVVILGLAAVWLPAVLPLMKGYYGG